MEKIKRWWANWEGVSASTVKLIAVLTMLADHAAAGILGRYLLQAGIWRAYHSGASAYQEQWIATYGKWNLLYLIMRYLGRIAFPIYCFLLVEGLRHTRSAGKYLLRLLIFALLSEIPFDLCLNGRMLNWEYQNVFFTLAIGLGVMILMEEVKKRVGVPWLSWLLRAGIVAAGCALAYGIQCDYNYRGVLCIVVFYLFSGNKILQLVAGALAFSWEPPAVFLAFVPLALYKKKKGWSAKYFFYAFYPVHLLLIYLLAFALGLSAFPAFNYLLALY